MAMWQGATINQPSVKLTARAAVSLPPARHGDAAADAHGSRSAQAGQSTCHGEVLAQQRGCAGAAALKLRYINTPAADDGGWEQAALLSCPRCTAVCCTGAAPLQRLLAAGQAQPRQPPALSPIWFKVDAGGGGRCVLRMLPVPQTGPGMPRAARRIAAQLFRREHQCACGSGGGGGGTQLAGLALWPGLWAPRPLLVRDCEFALHLCGTTASLPPGLERSASSPYTPVGRPYGQLRTLASEERGSCRARQQAVALP
jgi:hypothetical protein